ncbi:hypothetical protein I7I48_11148 [Histoplasma ohiense]|nr:hypothetical protein I7I48_11148 [Histoplasma ohiense (nom. inval.)]
MTACFFFQSHPQTASFSPAQAPATGKPAQYASKTHRCQSAAPSDLLECHRATLTRASVVVLTQRTE